MLWQFSTPPSRTTRITTEVVDSGVPVDGSVSTLWSGAARAARSLAGAAGRLQDAFEPSSVEPASARGYFKPAEEEALTSWFARFLTVRSSLWELLEEIADEVEWDIDRVVANEDWRRFGVGYLAACVIVALDRFLVEHVAVDTLVQRKLNEEVPQLRIPRKQFTRVFESVSEPRHALMLLHAVRMRTRHRAVLDALAEGDSEEYAWIFGAIARWEGALDTSRRAYARRLLRYGRHSLRRRGASARQKAIFGLLQASGRVVAELRPRLRPARVTPEVGGRLRQLLRPGDVLVTRYDVAASNLFLPGFWPHAALYVGVKSDLQPEDIELEPRVDALWQEPLRVLEALKDGVLLRPLESTLGVDAVAVIRPRLELSEIARGLGRALRHEGKMYNFDFDFFRGDRLVCTEVVYRAFDGLGSLDIGLHERAGRPTLSAEDLLDLALDSRGFEPVAVFGAPSCAGELVQGETARRALAESYRR